MPDGLPGNCDDVAFMLATTTQFGCAKAIAFAKTTNRWHWQDAPRNDEHDDTCPLDLGAISLRDPRHLFSELKF